MKRVTINIEDSVFEELKNTMKVTIPTPFGSIKDEVIKGIIDTIENEKPEVTMVWKKGESNERSYYTKNNKC